MWKNEFETEKTGNRSRIFYEPINSNAPHDDTCRVHCCYTNTVIFYKQPWEYNGRGGYAEWDRIETQWDNYGERFTDEDWGWQSIAPFVIHEGKLYELSTGNITWLNGRWYMVWTGWIVDASDRRWPYIKDKPNPLDEQG